MSSKKSDELILYTSINFMDILVGMFTDCLQRSPEQESSGTTIFVMIMIGIIPYVNYWTSIDWKRHWD